MDCLCCNVNIPANEWRRLGSYVASDCQPVKADLALAECRSCGHVQKVTDALWLATCDAIYANYRIYHQAAGSEQKARSVAGGELSGRSVLITDFLRRLSLLREEGNVIDIGCGNGAFLRAFHMVMPAWSIHGAEINRSFETDVVGVCSGARFWSPDQLGRTETKFDFVTLIHCLEHISHPIDFLKNARRLLAPGGMLLIEVPDVENNPFDLCIADHASHFSAATLERIVQRAGLSVDRVGNLVLDKELTLIARNDQEDATGDGQYWPARPFLGAHMEALEKARRITVALSSEHAVGVFGSSIAASWLANSIGDCVGFFVDEDTDRIGRQHMGRPILAPNMVPEGSMVVCALAPRLAEVIAPRMAGLPWRLVTCY